MKLVVESLEHTGGVVADVPGGGGEDRVNTIVSLEARGVGQGASMPHSGRMTSTSWGDRAPAKSAQRRASFRISEMRLRAVSCHSSEARVPSVGPKRICTRVRSLP